MLTNVDTESRWLAETLRLATENVAAGGGPFGALVAGPTGVVSAGVNRVTTDLDPSAHAEIVAIRAACRALGIFSLRGHVLVSSCEPCPMCLSTALWARIDRVVYAGDRNDAAKAGFDDLAFYELFDRPREQWRVPVIQLSTSDGFAPFAAWLDHPARIEY